MNQFAEPVPGAAELVNGEPGPDTLLDQLAAKRQAISETHETLIPVTGYDVKPPILLVKYRLLEGAELRMLGDKISRETRDAWQRQVFSSVDSMIAACTGIYVDRGDGSAPQPLQYNHEPINGFTEELAMALKYRDELSDPPTARSIVFGLFGKNDIAITQHFYLLNRWSANTSLDVRDEMMAGNL